MTGSTLLLKFNTAEQAQDAREAGQRVVLLREVVTDGGSQKRLLAWTAFAPRPTATLTFQDTFFVYAATTAPQPPQDTDGPEAAPPVVYMLSPHEAILGATYSFRDGDFHSSTSDNGISLNSIKIFNAFDWENWLAFGLAAPLHAQEFSLPKPPLTPDTPEMPDCAPIVLTKLPYHSAVTFTPRATVKVALAQDVTPGQVLDAVPEGALALTFDAGTPKQTATYDPDSGTFKADGQTSGSSGSGRGGGSGSGDAEAADTGAGGQAKQPSQSAGGGHGAGGAGPDDTGDSDQAAESGQSSGGDAKRSGGAGKAGGKTRSGSKS